jgi:hypothetical protein
LTGEAAKNSFPSLEDVTPTPPQPKDKLPLKQNLKQSLLPPLDGFSLLILQSQAEMTCNIFINNWS